MILISNQQRDDILRYIDLLCEAYKSKKECDTRSYNVCRRAGILRKQLMKKTSFSASELPEELKKISDFKVIIL